MTIKASKKTASNTVSNSSASPAVASSAETTQDPAASPPKGAFGRAIPKDWKPAKLGRGNGARANSGQTSNAAVAGKELGTSRTYAQDFGPHAPSQATLGRLLTMAAAWRKEWVISKRYLDYAAEQNASWWEAAQEGASLFQPAFDYAIARDPSLEERYPSTTQFMQAASAIAKRGASSRKAAKAGTKAAAKGKASAAVQAAVPAADAVAPDVAPEVTAPATEK